MSDGMTGLMFVSLSKYICKSGMYVGRIDACMCVQAIDVIAHLPLEVSVQFLLVNVADVSTVKLQVGCHHTPDHHHIPCMPL